MRTGGPVCLCRPCFCPSLLLVRTVGTWGRGRSSSEFSPFPLCTPPSPIIAPGFTHRVNCVWRFHKRGELYQLQARSAQGPSLPGWGRRSGWGQGREGWGWLVPLKEKERKTTQNDGLAWHYFPSATFSLSYKGQGCQLAVSPAGMQETWSLSRTAHPLDTGTHHPSTGRWRQAQEFKVILS